MGQFQGRFIDIAPDVCCGEDCEVWSFAVICAGVTMGNRCVVGSKAYIGKGATLGDDVHIQDGAHLTEGITVGHRVFFGAGVLTTDDKYPRVNNPAYTKQPPIIDDDVAIGAGAVILPCVHLYRGCTVGAGAVVVQDVDEEAVMVGNPARKLRE